MAEQIQKDMAVAILDEVTERLSRMVKQGGFDNASVIWLIKAWTKVGVRLRGHGYHRQSMAYYTMKRDAQPTKEKRSRMLLNAMEAFASMLSRHGTTEGDYFNRVDQVMRDFVWDYRKQVSLQPDKGKSEKEFVAMMVDWQNKSAEQVMNEAVAGVERHN